MQKISYGEIRGARAVNIFAQISHVAVKRVIIQHHIVSRLCLHQTAHGPAINRPDHRAVIIAIARFIHALIAVREKVEPALVHPGKV